MVGWEVDFGHPVLVISAGCWSWTQSYELMLPDHWGWSVDGTIEICFFVVATFHFWNDQTGKVFVLRNRCEVRKGCDTMIWNLFNATLKGGLSKQFLPTFLQLFGNSMIIQKLPGILERGNFTGWRECRETPHVLLVYEWFHIGSVIHEHILILFCARMFDFSVS